MYPCFEIRVEFFSLNMLHVSLLAPGRSHDALAFLIFLTIPKYSLLYNQ